MELEFIPRKRLLECLREGFTLVPKHEYQVGDYAVLMCRPGVAKGYTEETIQALMLRFQKWEQTTKNNISAGRSSYYSQRYGREQLQG